MKPLLFLLLFSPFLLPAQTDSTRLDTLRAVTISTTRLPTNPNTCALPAIVLESDYIRQGQAQLSLNESLAAVPGIFMLNDANYAQDLRISIRGFGARAAFGLIWCDWKWRTILKPTVCSRENLRTGVPTPGRGLYCACFHACTPTLMPQRTLKHPRSTS